MMTLTIPAGAVLFLSLAVVCGIVALLALGSAALSREISHWASDRARRLREWLAVVRIVALMTGAVLAGIAILVTIAEVPRV